MKKVLCLSSLILIGISTLCACGSKEESTKFTSEQTSGSKTILTVKHKDNKVTGMSYTMILDKEKIGVTTKDQTKELVKNLESSSQLKNVKTKETKKEIKISADAPSSLLKKSEKFTDGEKSLKSAGFKEEK